MLLLQQSLLKLIGRHRMRCPGREKRNGREEHNNDGRNNKHYNSNTCNVSIGSQEKGYIESKKKNTGDGRGEPKECYPKNCNSDQYLGWLSMCV